MADQIFNALAGVPPPGPTRWKDVGDGTFAPVSVGIAGNLPLLSLSAVSVTGPGAVLDNTGVRNNHSMFVTTSAGVSGGVVALQGSQDGVNFVNLPGTSTITTSAANTTSIVSPTSLIPVRYLRANITTAITGGTVTAYIASAG
jgi:hypothetical protein